MTMLSNETVRKLHEMRLGVMAEAFSTQLEDVQFQSVSFEDRFAMLVDAEWSARKSNRLVCRLRQMLPQKCFSLFFCHEVPLLFYDFLSQRGDTLRGKLLKEGVQFIAVANLLLSSGVEDAVNVRFPLLSLGGGAAGPDAGEAVLVVPQQGRDRRKNVLVQMFLPASFLGESE